MHEKPTVLITGVSGSLGFCLLEELRDFHIIGVGEQVPAEHENLTVFEKIDLAEERSCEQLVDLMQLHRPEAVVHMAFVARPSGPGTAERKRMWLVNVAGTGRVAEAIAEHNRRGGTVQKFVHLSTAALHAAHGQKAVAENALLEPRNLPWLLDKRESDLAVQARAKGLRQCKTYLLRPQTFVGATARNYLMNALRGIPGGKRTAERLRRKGARVAMLLPRGPQYLERKHQVVHMDDMARLITHILRRKLSDPQLSIMNVAGRGDPLTLRKCIQLAKTRVRRLPGKTVSRQAIGMLWGMGLSSVPPEAMGCLLDAAIADISRLRVFLGDNYRSVIQYTCEEALADTFAEELPTQPANRVIG